MKRGAGVGFSGAKVKFAKSSVRFTVEVVAEVEAWVCTLLARDKILVVFRNRPFCFGIIRYIAKDILALF
jgi:hypothetical protein